MTSRQAVVILGCLIVVGCGSKPEPVMGELGHIRRRSADIAIDGEFVRRSYGYTVHTFDVSDPRNPFDTELEAYAFIGCDQSVAVVGGNGYCLSSQELAQVGLPSAGFPDWYVELPDAGFDAYLAYTMRSLPDGRLLIARAGTAEARGDFLLVDVSQSSPQFEQVLDPLTGHIDIDLDGLRVASPVGGPVLTIHDFSLTATTSYEIARIPLPSELSEGNTPVVFEGNDLVAAMDLSSSEGHTGTVFWYRISDDWTSVAELGRVEDVPIDFYSPDYRWGLELADGYAFVDLHEGVGVFRLDPAEGLVHVRTLDAPGEVGRIIADTERRLLYVGGYSFQVFDLGAVTTGEPDW